MTKRLLLTWAICLVVFPGIGVVVDALKAKPLDDSLPEMLLCGVIVAVIQSWRVCSERLNGQ